MAQIFFKNSSLFVQRPFSWLLFGIWGLFILSFVALNSIIKWSSQSGIQIAVKQYSTLISSSKYKFCLHIVKCFIVCQPNKVENSRGSRKHMAKCFWKLLVRMFLISENKHTSGKSMDNMWLN